MSKEAPEGTGEARKMNAFNNLISQLLNKRTPTESQSEPTSLRQQDKNHSLRPANGEHPESLDDSPTPKRRKLAQSSPIDKTAGPAPSSSKSEPAASSVLTINSENVRLSPGTKTVAFSDQVQSSPTQHTLRSSPRLSPALKPSKSILRNGITIEKSVSDLTYDKPESSSKLAGRVRASDHFFRAKDPRYLEFWTSGEVHNLRDPSSMKEFRQILDGGLKILARTDNESLARRFEIYATFNTIIVSLPAMSGSEVMERRATQIIGILERIVNICLPQLVAEQKKLLEAEDKKDPFVSRLYIQIVRFFGYLLSNYRIVRSLTKDTSLRDRLKAVFELSSVALTHRNSNKAIIGAQFSFLADEKYGPYFMNRDEVSNMIHAVLSAKEIQSANLVCEKLFLLKSLISKHTDVMLQLLPSWLPQVLSRTLIEDDYSTITILQAAISVLLELLKKSIDSSVRQQDIVKCIRESLARDILPKRLHDKLLNDGNVSYGTMTLEELVQKQITYLIVFKKECKLAMDLWLAMMGLLYNNTRTLLELSDSDDRGWLNLNHICFLSGELPNKLIALKAWRIIIYCTWSHIKGKSSVHDIALSRILKKPFELTASHVADPNVCEGLLYYLTGLVYTTCGTPKSQKAGAFQFFWNELIADIYGRYIFKSGNIVFRSRAIKLLLRLIMKEKEDKSHKLERKKAPVIKVISTSGIALNDIQPVPTSLLQGSFESVMKLIFGAIKSDLADWSANYELFTNLVEHLPSKLADEKHFTSFLNIAFELSGSRESSTSSDMFLRLSSAMMGPFADLIISDGKIFETLVGTIDHLPERQVDSKLRLLKEFSKKLKGRVSDLRINEIFVGIDDASCKQYISNWIGSVILSPEISPGDYESLLKIVQSVRSAEAIENLLGLCSKFGHSENLFELLQLGEWNDEEFIRFVKIYLNYNNQSLEQPFKEELKDMLSSRENVFKQVMPDLIRFKLFDFITEVITSNFRLADILLSEYGSSSFGILPVDQLSNFMLNFQAFSDYGQFFITKWALSLDNPEELFDSGKVFFDFIFHLESDGNINDDRRALLDQILEKLYKHGSWTDLSNFIKLCIANHQTTLVEQLFKIKGTQKLGLLSPAAIAYMVGKCGLLDDNLKEYIREAYHGMRVDFILKVTDSLLNLRKVECFDFWGAQFLVFFLMKAQSFEELVQDECREIFKKFINVLLSDSNKLVIPFVTSMLKIMASDMTSYTLDLFDFLAQHPNSEFVFGNLKQCDDLVGKLRKGVPVVEEDAVELEGANSGDKIRKPNELMIGHSEDPEELPKSAVKGSDRHLEISKNEPEVQVPATQNTAANTRDSADLPLSAAGNDSLLSSNSVDLTTFPTVSNASEQQNENASTNESFGNKSESRSKSSGTAIRGIKEDQNSANKAVIVLDSDDTSEKMKQELTETKASQPVNSSSSVSSAPSGQNLKHRKENTSSQRSGDDFADVEMDQDDEFLKAMENKMAVASHEQQSLPGSQSVELTDRQQAVTATQAESDIETKIRFPIFNFSKLSRAATSDDTPVQLKQLPQEDAVTNTAQPETISDELEKQEDLRRMEEIMSQEATASLRIHFPSKKARRVVSRLRALTIEDITNLTPQEKRNLRIELLDFLMNLEHEKELCD
ncbi:hypothetical protein HG537_0A07000 [Torulaspora globosa]|uniref:Telomere-associated protein Rif1 N-terminal domain-containing protein n=1 Tax=Torulaspora globosa TaxID=48254 RepID=A0A7H9HMD0_9SACH|nr:hypothetical protein HG537_0A07000 [Torulaspora sp. CBS 2947]